MFQAMAEVKHELTKYVEPVWSGTIAYRGLIPAEHLRADAPHSALLRPMMVGILHLLLHARTHHLVQVVLWKE